MKSLINSASIKKEIKYGDRIFVRLTVGHRTMLELTVSCVSDLTDLLSILRTNMRGFRGLTSMYLRNLSRGWSTTRPLMIYADSKPAPRPAVEPSLFSEPAPQPAPRQLMPWDL